VQDYRRLRVYANAHALAISVRAATRVFPRSGYASLKSQMTSAAESIGFNIVEGCCASSQKEFARFLQKANDVQRFAKLPEQFGFAIEYTDNKVNLRYYEPDFVVLAKNGIHHIIETKGLEDVNVVNKDRAAKLWCENTTRLTGKPWDYLKVLQTEFTRLQPTSFSDLLVLSPSQLV